MGTVGDTSNVALFVYLIGWVIFTGVCPNPVIDSSISVKNKIVFIISIFR